MTNGPELFSLEGKVALVTGATGYLGKAMVTALAAAGATVLVNSRSTQRAQSLVNELQNRGWKARSAVFDVTDSNAIKTFIDSLGGSAVDIVINNAYVGGGGTIESADSEQYRLSYDVTVTAAQTLLTLALPNLRRAVSKRGYASVINIASMYGMVSPDPRMYDSAGGTNPPFYGAAKAALIQWSRYAACEFGPEGIRINSVSPGPFPAKTVQQSAQAFVANLASKVPLGRVGQAHEIQGPILFLASGASSFVNASNLVVDGGWTSW